MINFNEFDIEEHDNSPLRPGDKIELTGHIRYYTSPSMTNDTHYGKRIFLITHVSLGKDVRIDGDNNYYPNGIAYDGYIYRFKDHWPWFDISKAKITKLYD